MLRQRYVLSYTLLLSGLIFATGCPDDDAASTQNGNTSNGSSSSNNNAMMSDTSNFEVEKKDNTSDMSQKEANEIDNDQASKATSGAAIAGSTLSIYLVAPNGTTISAIIETSETSKAPGDFAVGEPPEGSFVTWLAPVNGQILNSKSGTIKLDGCPKASGDKVVGSFQGVELLDEFSGSTQTLTGKFDVALYSVSGALLCKPPEMDPDPNNSTPSGNNNNSPNPAMCDAEICADDGTCCPYAQCMATCEFRCLTQDPACNNPLNADPVKCSQCLEGCLDECNVSQECRTEYTALSTCETQAGCDSIEDDEDSFECSQQNCCEELESTW